MESGDHVIFCGIAECDPGERAIGAPNSSNPADRWKRTGVIQRAAILMSQAHWAGDRWIGWRKFEREDI